MKLRFFFYLFFLFILNQVNGQDISVSVTPNQIMIGDHLDLTIRASNANHIIFPVISDSTIGNFRLVENLKPDTLYSGNDVTISKRYIVTCFEDSVQIFPALAFVDRLSATKYSKPIQIAVNSPNIDSAKDIKSIKNIILVPLSKAEVFSYLFVSLILLGLILVIYFVYIKFIRKEALWDLEKPEDPAHVAALKSLKETETEQLWQKGKTKEYYDRISDAVRLYIEKRFGIKALEQTTFEILAAIRNLDLPKEIEGNMKELLELSDLAKFAKENPEKESNIAILKHAYSFIQNTQMSYDANKKANALQVRKFYGQNKYGYKISAINQTSFRILAYGLIAVFALLSLTILSAYYIPVDRLLGMIADSAILFFFWFIVLGVLITLLLLYFVKGNMSSYLLVFDYNSINIKRRNNQYTIPFGQLLDAKLSAKGDLEIKELTEKKHIISKKIEYFDEVRERIQDIIDIEHITPPQP